MTENEIKIDLKDSEIILEDLIISRIEYQSKKLADLNKKLIEFSCLNKEMYN